MALIDGFSIAQQTRQVVKHAIDGLPHGLSPTLATLLVGDDAPSALYVQNKLKACAEVGIVPHLITLPSDVGAQALAEQIEQLNANPAIHGILLQLPLPAPLQGADFIKLINPAKDVDGLHPLNAGLLLQADPQGLVPCTPQGCMRLLKSTGLPLRGKQALVIGRSVLVGRPMAALLLNADCTTTIAHSQTANLPQLVQQADIVVAAIGKPRFVQGAWIKEGAVVLDVGINRTPAGLCGDVDFATAAPRAAFITPVPRGVGPMTVACLMMNTVIAACRQHNHPLPPEFAL